MYLGASYNQEQEYFYEFKGNKELADYEVSEIFVDGKPALQSTVDGAKGSFVIPAGANVKDGFTVEVGVKAKNVLEGDEALELTIDTQEKFGRDAKQGTAKIANFDDCVIDGLVQAIQATGACIDEDVAKVALFTFNVELSGAYNKEAQEYFYKFESNRALGDGYTVDQVLVNGVEIKTPSPEGGFELPQETAAGSDIQVQV